MNILEQAGMAGEPSKLLIKDSMIKLYTAWNAQDPDPERTAKLGALKTMNNAAGN